MVNFKIKLAGIVIGVTTIYDYTLTMCSSYLTDSTANIAVRIEPADIIFEREKADREASYEGHTVKAYSEPYLESQAVYRKIVEQLLDFNIILFHGSAVSVDDEAYLFIAKSGTGKSTHTRLWREVFKERAVMINDDKPLIKISSDNIMVCGTPWSGKHRIHNNIMVPLKAVCIIERGDNTISKINRNEAWPVFLQQCYRSPVSEKLIKTMDLLDILLKQVALYRLYCNMEKDAVKAAYECMNRNDTV